MFFFRSGDQRDYASEDSVQAKCFNVCQGAAVRISSLGAHVYSLVAHPTDMLLVDKFHNVFDVKRGPPFLIIFIQSAGYVSIHLCIEAVVLINLGLCIL